MPTHQQAFENLKFALVSPPILDYSKLTDSFVLTTDASDVGLGAVMSTSQGTEVEYAKYTTIEKHKL